jgi:hypothetical protein
VDRTFKVKVPVCTVRPPEEVFNAIVSQAINPKRFKVIRTPVYCRQDNTFMLSIGGSGNDLAFLATMLNERREFHSEYL